MKPNVLQLVSSFRQGGSERQAAQITRMLHETGRYHVHVACLDREGALLDEVSRLGLGEVAEFRLGSFYNRNAVRQLRRFAQLLRERRIDIVQTYDFYTNVFGMTGARLASVPVRIAARRETEGVRTKAQKWTERRAFNLAHTIVANSEAVRRELIAVGVEPAKVVTIYNGMDTSRIAPISGLIREKVLDELGLPVEPHRRFVTIVANMHFDMKDQATFLRAARRVLREVPDAAFVLGGEGGLVESLRALSRELGLERDAFFIGRCARVADLLAVSTVCVLSSKGLEGFSNSIMEYMAAARPVVATDVGGAREAVAHGETGYIVRPTDDEEMAGRIISLLKDPEGAREMGARGLARVREKFSCEAQLAEIEKLYERLLSRGRGKKLARAGEGVRREVEVNVKP
ncbi:MAG TPA: glycosyltransferase [Pyrinomonadaceae bacterium]|jgi:glycosyltransferase involved in cell wall biosynthesis